MIKYPFSLNQREGVRWNYFVVVNLSKQLISRVLRLKIISLKLLGHFQTKSQILDQIRAAGTWGGDAFAFPWEDPESRICYQLSTAVLLGGEKLDIAHKKKLCKYLMRRGFQRNIVAISSIILGRTFPATHGEILVLEWFWPKSRVWSRCGGWGVQIGHRPQEKSIRDLMLTRYRTENQQNHHDYPGQIIKTYFLDFPIVAALSS